MKKITICGKEYPIKCSALVFPRYRKLFNKDIFDDINIVNMFISERAVLLKRLKEKHPELKDEAIFKELTGLLTGGIGLFVEASTRLAYVMINMANKDIAEYEEWLETVPRICVDDDWIVEVADIAIDCFRR